VLFGLAVGIAGMLGDLAESLMKRDLGAKDSSTWMPGFGGVLDIIDSILLAAPVAYLCGLLEIT
jgi:phosphatidate cytidylyltransferase